MKKQKEKSSSLTKEEAHKELKQKLEEIAKREKKIDAIFHIPREAMMKHFSK